MQMILIERFFSTANIIRTKAKVRVSPKGWRTVFRRFAECKFLFARRQKCMSAQKAGARSLEDLLSAKINIILETCKRLTVFYFLYSISMQSQSKNKNIVKVSLPTETEQIKIPPLLVGRSNNLGK
jgi:NADH:ubiquinone oxidoreductase subunit C